jgi:predicted HTH domain antitoxin
MVNVMQLILEIPDQYIQGKSQHQLAQQVKLYAAMVMFQSSQLSRKEASEFAGVGIFDFFEACKEFNICVYNASNESVEIDSP